MKVESLRSLFVEQLKDLYNAETQLVKALPKMAKAASSEQLSKGFEEHLEQTMRQVERLERIAGEIGFSPKGKKCEAMEGLIEEGRGLMEASTNPAVRDAALIAIAQKIAHYEMASYGCARSWAEQLGLQEAYQLLRETYEEEKRTDEDFTRLAEGGINAKAGTEPQANRGGNRAANEFRPGRVRQAAGSARGGQEGNGHGQTSPREQATMSE